MYNYIFYKGYQLAKNLKNWNDTPILFSTMTIGLCAIFNFGTILFLIEGFLNDKTKFDYFFTLINIGRFVVGGIVILTIYFYYAKGNRGERIVAIYKDKEDRDLIPSIHPAIVLLSAYVISFSLCLLAGMYKNQDGIFG